MPLRSFFGKKTKCTPTPSSFPHIRKNHRYQHHLRSRVNFCSWSVCSLLRAIQANEPGFSMVNMVSALRLFKIQTAPDHAIIAQRFRFCQDDPQVEEACGESAALLGTGWSHHQQDIKMGMIITIFDDPNHDQRTPAKQFRISNPIIQTLHTHWDVPFLRQLWKQ